MIDPVEIRLQGVGTCERIELDNGVIRLVAAPGLGGRVLSVRHRGREHLYRNPRLLDEDLRPVEGVALGPVDGPMSAWNNVGGDKTWPAPQGWDGPEEWAGPPDPVLDSGHYAAETASAPDGSVTLTLTSADDPRSGLRLRRRLTLEPGAAGYRLDLEALNVSDTVRRWALWNVTQIDGAPGARRDTGGVFVGVEGDGPHTVELVAGNGNPRVEEHTPRVMRVPSPEVVGKVGFPTASGWLAHVGAAGTLTQRFDVSEGADYPDSGSRAEVWSEVPVERPLEHLGGLCPVDRVTEVEALGPLTELAPGERATLGIEVGFGAGTEAVTEVTPDGFWSEPPHWVGFDSGGGRLAGAFTALRSGALVHRASGHIVAQAEPGESTRWASPVPGADEHTATDVEFVP
ncbi:DUF4380 domain-containing protein [Nocardiopsis sp. JB363]|uniref:DUF4380 domain-containing protein n=1 Tax=Nocardiopsis sp. JB363 TaxID=1434837 RepID=UPI00097B00A3|nr:DUF4380 domain-containing protein [Nocardiopsis sp. JB363]SIO85843.1 hypothetical protein BQ8420_09000 [Nocardiopsis sp. JB363]